MDNPLRTRHAIVCLLTGALLLAALGPRCAHAQLRDTIPSRQYSAAFVLLYEGRYETALKEFLDVGRGGVQGANGRWIDSICYYAMVGECYYQLGNFPKAQEYFGLALQQYLVYPNWFLRVQWPNVGPTRAQFDPRRMSPWGVSARTKVVGQFPDQIGMTTGDIQRIPGLNTAISNLRQVPIDVEEITRCLAHSLRRFRELLGPAGRFNPLVAQVKQALGARPIQPGSWGEAWIDVLLGLAFRCEGDDGNALPLLRRGLTLPVSQLDHPLTPIAFFELGQIAFAEGKYADARAYFEEAAFAQAYFMRVGGPGLVEEALRWASVAHQLADRGKPYGGINAATLEWARRDYPQVFASLSVAAAEAALSAGVPLRQVNSLLGGAAGVFTRARGEMNVGLLAARFHHIRAMAAYAGGNVTEGETALRTALDLQRGGASFWLYHIALVDALVRAPPASLSVRSSLQLYEEVLRDPTDEGPLADWRAQPLESLAILTTSLLGPLEGWYALAMRSGDRDPSKPLEIADRIRRHRYYLTLPLGGRLLSLRWLLEDDPPQADARAAAIVAGQRGEIINWYPQYKQLSDRARALLAELKAMPLAPQVVEEQVAQKQKLAELEQLSLEQERLLRLIALGRNPAPLAFPRLRPTDEIRQQLANGQYALVYIVTAQRGLDCFLLGNPASDVYAAWQVRTARDLHAEIGNLLRDLGNYQNNAQVPQERLTDTQWKQRAAALYEELFKGGPAAGLPPQLDELVIVPDGVLWYLPFEILQLPASGGETQSLIARCRIRYVPTFSLAPSDPRPRQPLMRTAVVAGRLYPGDDPAVARNAMAELAQQLPHVVEVPPLLPASSPTLVSLLDRLVVYEDLRPSDAGPYHWSPIPLDRNKAVGALANWIALPWGAPQECILPGFSTPASNALKDLAPAAAGSDVFLSVCALMSCGTRTILLSRWRVGGKSSYDSVREFVQELPHGTASAAWRRAVFAGAATPLSPALEPRIRSSNESATFTAAHPFFWSGYLLVDTGARPLPKTDEDVPAGP
jgi:tetratricopeptide (TPR) repeat protein/CHAT domain-containing protein